MARALRRSRSDTTAAHGAPIHHAPSRPRQAMRRDLKTGLANLRVRRPSITPSPPPPRWRLAPGARPPHAPRCIGSNALAEQRRALPPIWRSRHSGARKARARSALNLHPPLCAVDDSAPAHDAVHRHDVQCVVRKLPSLVNEGVELQSSDALAARRQVQRIAATPAGLRRDEGARFPFTAAASTKASIRHEVFGRHPTQRFDPSEPFTGLGTRASIAAMLL